MTRIRITPDGTIRGLWTDEIAWQDLGRLAVRRASHVEFCDRRQMWSVRAARPCSALRAIFQMVTGRPSGEVLYLADTRQDALAWERRYYEPGGPGWTADETPGSATPAIESGLTVPREELQ